ALSFAGSSDAGLEAAERAVELEPTFPASSWSLGWVRVQRGEFDAGLSALEQAVAYSARSFLLVSMLGTAYAQAGRADAARRLVAELEGRDAGPTYAALILWALGEEPRALALLEQGFAQRNAAVWMLGTVLAPGFRPVGADPRWLGLLERNGLGSLAVALRARPSNPSSHSSPPQSHPSHVTVRHDGERPNSGMTLFATKPIATLRAEAEVTGEHALVRALGPLNLVTLGIGAVIGAGIFVITGQVAALYAGPAVPLSMILVGVSCAFAGLCYAEMASAVPVAGSAYTYSYATMGELAAWIIGWDLVLEYAAGAATVGVGWSGHFVSLLGLFGVRIPASLTAPPTQLCTAAQVTAHAVGCAHPGLNLTGAIINLPAVLIVAVMSAVLVIGISESARVNSAIVILKVDRKSVG